jgi:hypothetical protein
MMMMMMTIFAPEDWQKTEGVYVATSTYVPWQMY